MKLSSPGSVSLKVNEEGLSLSITNGGERAPNPAVLMAGISILVNSLREHSRHPLVALYHAAVITMTSDLAQRSGFWIKIK